MSGSIERGLVQGSRRRMRVHAGLMALAMGLGGATASYALVTPPTIANNTFASTPVGQSLTQTVTLTLTSASAIKSIALATGTSASSEFALESTSGCTVDGTTSNPSGTVCKLSVKYTPLHPGSLASPNLSRNAQLLYTDGGSNVTAYGLAGAATKAVGHVVPGTISLYAGMPYTVTGTSPLDNGLGQVNGAYAGNGVAATSASFQFATYNAIFSNNVPSNGSQPMAFDSQGNLYVIDGANDIIRKIDNSAQHLVTTIAGTASAQGYTGNGGLATSAKLNAPRGLTLDAAGNIYFLDDTTVKEYIFPVSVIRRIDAVTGIITVVAGQNFNGTTYDSADGGGTCNISNNSAYAVYQCGDGGLATYAFLNEPYNLALDAAGNFYLWASGSTSEGTVILRKIDGSTGIITTIGNETNLGATQAYGGMTIAADGNLYVYVIDTATEQIEVKQFNPATMVATALTGTASGSYSTANCQLPAVQQKGFAAADLFMVTGATSGSSQASGDLSADASGNLYLSDALCTNGAVSVYNFPPSIVRVNIASATAYDEVVADAFPYGGTATIGYNAFYFYNIDPVSAIPDNAGNIFFTSWNQIAELSGQNAEIDFTERYDYTTSAAQTATYANLGNQSGVAPTYALHAGTNFVVLDGSDTNACDVLTAVAEGGACDLDLAFSPVAVGPLTDVLNVSGDGTAETVTVDGIGDAAAAQDVSPATLNFGNQTLNVASAPKTVTITDTGTANLTVYGAFPDGTDGFANYQVVANGGTCSTTTSTVITPGKSCTLEITFTPSALGSLPAALNLNTTIGQSDVVTLAGTGVPAPAKVTETGNLWFNPAPVAIAAASAQTLTATFTITGATSVITPTAVMHYGLAYKVGAVTCTGAAGNQTCTVPVTFIPNYPGGRKDALFLMNGTTRLATQLAYGVGESPFAMIQPGTVTNPISNNAHYLYDSVVDENGTVYVYLNNTIYSVTAAGVVTQLAVPGPDSNSNLSIDGAGVIYFGAPAGDANAYVTYDTVQGIVGSVATPSSAAYYDGIAAGNEGNLYMVDDDTNKLYTVKPDGTNTSLTLTYDKPYHMVVDSAENLFGSSGGNGTVDEITPAGVQTKANSNGGGLGIDAAATVYLERFGLNGVAGVGELPASDYADAVGLVDRSTNPTGNASVAPDGTVYVGNYNNLDKVDRTQQTIAFGEQSNGSASQPATFQIYNGGNEDLTLATFAVTGDGFAIPSGTTDTCTAGMTIKPGALCNAPIVFTGTHSGNFTGSIAFTSNTLNTTATSVTVPLSAYVNGIYVTVAPNPLSFGNQADNTTSSTKTVTFTNSGVNADASIGSPSSVDGFTISQGTCTSNIAPGSSCSFNVTFRPTAAQAYTGTVNVTAGSDASTQSQALSFTVNGTGTPAAAPAASLSPTTLTFPNTTVNSTATAMSTTLSNTGNATLNITGITLSDTTDFAKTTTCGSTLAAGKTCTISVTFTPGAAQSYSATLSVADDAAGSPQTVALSGSGAGAVSASPTTVAFGNEVEYTETTPQKVTITNGTSSPITFGSLVFSNGFVLYQDDCGSQLAANSTCYYLVSFFPKAVSAFTGTLSIPYTGTTGSPLTVNLTGTGTVGIPSISLFPAPDNLGTEPVMTAAPAISIEVDAGGYAPQNDFTVAITGANASDFTETDTCAGATAVPGDIACNISVTFVPSAEGLRTATLTVTSNSGTVSTSTTLTGAGVAKIPQLQFSPTQLNLFAGSGAPCADATSGAATAATLCNITGSAQDYLGNTYLVDNTYNVVYKVDTTGKLSVFAGTPSKTGGYTGDSGPATSATLSGPTAVAADAFGDVFISDTGNGAIREVDTTGMITSFLDGTCDEGGKGTPISRESAAKPGNAHPHEVRLCETLKPEGLVGDGLGNLFFADTLNNVVLEVGVLQGGVKVVAGKYDGYIGNPGYNGDGIAANTAELNGPQDVAVDDSGNLYIADTLNYRVRMVTATSGLISTIAGNGTQGDTGDGAAATSAEINAYGVSIDPAADVFITSGTGGIVRKVDASGNINLFAGGGTGAIGGPASTGAVANAYFARIDDGGDLLIPGGLQVLEAGPDGLLQFGSQPQGSTSSALAVTLENTGDGYINLNTTVATVTGTNASDFALTGSNCGYTLMPGKTCVLSVTFDPSATGARTASLSVPTNAAGSPQIVLLQGNGSAASAPAASLSPTTLSFPNTAVGSTATAISTTLSNTGNATLTITGITLSDTTDFAETTTCGGTLDAGKTCTISVTFSPGSATAFTGTLSVADNAAGSPQTASLSGTGTPAPAPIASLSPTTLSFANTAVGSTSAAVSTTLSNTGNATLTITGITLSDTTDFAETTTCGSTLDAGKTCTISVTFSPGSAKAFTGTLSVADNAAGSPQTASLSGTGTPAPAPIASLSPTTLAFPNTNAGATSAALSTTLSNTGNAPLTITGITLSDTTDFAETTTCGSTLAAGSNCAISVTFKPGAAQAYTGTLSVADNAAGTPQTVALTGTGLTPPATDFTLTVTPPTATVTGGSAATFSINLKGIGGDFADAINLTATGLPAGATGTFNPSSVTPGANGANSTLTIQTPQQTALAQLHPLHGGTRAPWLAALLVIPLLGLRKRLKNLRVVSCLLVLIATLTPTMLLTGCGGGYFAITSQTYTVTVTATSGSIQHSTTVTLTVEQQ